MNQHTYNIAMSFAVFALYVSFFAVGLRDDPADPPPDLPADIAALATDIGAIREEVGRHRQHVDRLDSIYSDAIEEITTLIAGLARKVEDAQ